MRELREEIMLQCPVAEAEARVLAFFERCRESDGALRMRLRVPAGGASPYNYTLSRLVRVEAQMGRDDDGLNEAIMVAWRPEGSAMLPRFEGKLRVWGADDPASTVLELDGHYVPPFGPAGQIFDEAIGRQIARSTAHEFLRDVKRGVDLRGPG